MKWKKLSLVLLFLGITIWGAYCYAIQYRQTIYLQVAARTFITSVENEATAVVRIKNNSDETISSSLSNHFLSYHLLQSSGEVIQFDNIRTEIPNIDPGEVKEISMKIAGPIKAGNYLIEVDIVEEGVSWYKDLGNKTSVGKLHVKLL